MTRTKPLPEMSSIKMDDIHLLNPFEGFQHIEDREKCAQLGREINQYISDAHHDIVEKFGSRGDGIDEDRVLTFMLDKGINIEPYILIYESLLTKSRDLLAQYDPGFLDEYEGIYSTVLRLSLVVRHPEKERLFGPAYTEANLVHELEHSGSDHDQVIFFGESTEDALRSFKMPRVGHRVENFDLEREYTTGEFPEEARAELRAAEYRKMIREDDPTVPQNGFDITTKDGVLWLPHELVEFYQNPDGSYRTTHPIPALATRAFMLLNEIDDQVIPLLQAGRSSIDAANDMIQVLEEIKPGLSELIYSVEYTERDFTRGLIEVQNLAKEKGIQVAPEHSAAHNNPLLPPKEGKLSSNAVIGSDIFDAVAC